MAIKDPSKIQISIPQNKMDQVVAVLTGTFSVGAATVDAFGNLSSTAGSDTKTPPSNDFYLTKGIWSADGGASWQEFGNSIIYGSYNNGLKTLQVTVDSSVSPSGIGSIGISATNYDTSGHTIQYKILLMARYDQDNVPLGSFSRPLRYRSNLDYMKVFIDSSVDLDPNNPTVVSHGLGYVPNVVVWLKQTWVHADSDYGTIDLLMIGGKDVVVNSQNITFGKQGFAGFTADKAYYRVYLDA